VSGQWVVDVMGGLAVVCRGGGAWLLTGTASLPHHPGSQLQPLPLEPSPFFAGQSSPSPQPPPPLPAPSHSKSSSP
jgi:hypothetical protein